jgi:uncharacterized protein YjbI with pentapeptide repeats
VHTALADIDFRGARFHGCAFENVHWVNLDLRGARFHGCTFENNTWLND